MSPEFDPSWLMTVGIAKPIWLSSAGIAVLVGAISVGVAFVAAPRLRRMIDPAPSTDGLERSWVVLGWLWMGL